uniref:NADPH-dependent diflavin oxidoreductase 1 n=1 Tax=Lygus hesperus TaxID=30085 RepID=A0A146M198_LYGHE
MGVDPEHSLLILYGSETGTAQDAAERLWRQAVQRGLETRVMAMDDFPVTQLLYERLIVFVVATTGQGDPPANMSKTWTFLLRRSLPSNSLSSSCVAVLGLGDSSYVKFNFIAKKLHRRLTDGLGATPLCPAGLADDQHDLGPSAVIDPWSTELWSHIKTRVYPSLCIESVQDVSFENPLILRWGVTALSDDSLATQISAAPPDGSSYFVTLTSNLRTTPEDHFQDVRIFRMRSDEEGRKFSYSPGDVAYITPSNSSEAVDKFFSLFEANRFHKSNKVMLEQIHKGVTVPIQLSNKTFTLENCVRNYWDLSVIPSRSLFEVLASVSTDELEKEKLIELSSPAGTQELYDYCNRPRRTVLEVLADFPHSRSRLKLEHMFDLMRIIRPRAFSIASSPLESELMLLVAVVQYRTRLKAPRLGLCSNWLKNLPHGSKLHVTIKKGSLRFPSSNSNGDSSPVVMVGPGTGVAPFRSFIITEWLKESDEEKRPLTLFYGSRNREADYFFRKDWAKVHHLDVFTAFSRDQPHKIYVQHVLLDQKELIVNQLVSHSGHFFVAGSSKDMPEAVRNAVKKSAIEAGRMSDSEADKWLEKMDRENRYQQEVWS